MFETERAKVGQTRWLCNQDNKIDTLVSAEDEKNMNTSEMKWVSYIAFTRGMLTHIVRVKMPDSALSEEFEGGSDDTYRKGIQFAIRRVQARHDHLPLK